MHILRTVYMYHCCNTDALMRFVMYCIIGNKKQASTQPKTE